MTDEQIPPIPNRDPEYRELASPRTNAIVSSTGFKIIGPSTQSPYDIQVDLHFKRGDGTHYGERKLFDIDFPFATTVQDFPPGIYRIHYAYLLKDGGWSYWYDSGLFTVVSPTNITWPRQDSSVPSSVEITGEGAVPHATINVRGENGTVYGSGSATTQGNWKVVVKDLPVNRTTSLVAAQSRGDVEINTSVPLKLNVKAKPVITSPRAGEVLRELRPEVSGTGSNNTTVTIFQQGFGGVSYGSGTIANGVWKLKLTKNLPVGGFVVHAQATFNGQLIAWSDPVPVTVRYPAPLITGPEAGTVQDQTFTISGTGGMAGATVEILVDLDVEHTVLGTGSVQTGGSWNVIATLPPGPISVVAEQFVGSSEHSWRSLHRAFKIRPPQLTDVIPTATSDNTVMFSGVGHNGARVEIAKTSGPGGQSLGPVTVVNNAWQVVATNWPPGLYSFLATQKVSDGDGGWIVSKPFPFTYDWKVPAPTEVTYTVANYTPTFTGRGYNGATVELYNPGGASKAAPDALVANRRWSSQASEVWGPTLKREVHLRQRLGQVFSDWFFLEVTIPLLPPVITEMIDNEDTPIFNGTCWAGATVNLTFSDDPNVYPAVVQGDTWTYTRPEPFEIDITHTLTVTQHAAGQDSPSTILSFSINRVLPTPVFTAPEVNEEVGRDLLVEGTDGVAGGRVQLRDAQFDRDLESSDFLTMDGYWSVVLEGLAFREYRIEAVQIMGSRESLPSGVHVFKVVVLPPVIEVPGPEGAIARTAIISGTGMPFARVDVFLQGSAEPLLRDLLVNSEGHWRSEPVTLEIGHKTLWARQTFEGRPSKDSAHQAFSVVPAAPSIETPVAVGQVGRQAVVSGFGYAGDEVAVALSDEPKTVLGCVQVRNDRTWSVAVELDRPGGNYSLIAVQSRGEFHSSPSAERPVVLGTYVPSVEVPAPGRWVSDPVGFAGQGQTGKGVLVSWYNPERVLARDIVVTDQGWQRQARLNFSPGGHWVRFKQTIQRDVSWTESDWAESARFEVVSSPSELNL